MPHQLPPDGDWQCWVVLGGRGAGKTRTGAEWVRAQVEGARRTDVGRARHIALIAESVEQACDVMVFGESGILACTPPDRKPKWHSSRRVLIWPNGAQAKVVSAHDPERLRGPQFDGAWLDEFAKWKKAREVWDMLQFTLRLGDDPRVVVTTTPRNIPILHDILREESCVQTHAPMQDNRANLAPNFVEQVLTRYGDTRLGRQEIAGELLHDFNGAFWTDAGLESYRDTIAPKDFDRVVIGVDPSVGGGDDCGIVVVGAQQRGAPKDWRAYVLADCTVQNATPTVWADAVVAAARRFRADRVVAEINQGGALVETMLRQRDAYIPYHGVHARRGKISRAEPVSALYEQGRVFHTHGLHALETQMMHMTAQGYQGRGSPDRCDALVWALTELMLDAAARYQHPKIRSV